MSSAAPIRVLVVDDSAVVRRIISALLATEPAVVVVGEARNGLEAIQLTETLKPDIITMDVRMPVMDGLQATKQIMAYHPTPILVLTSSLGRHDRDLTFNMLNAGALEVLEKPHDLASATDSYSRRLLLDRIKVLSRVRVVTHLRGRRHKPSDALPPLPYPKLPATTTPSRLVIIGASTGGPRVLYKVLRELPPDFPAAIVIVQHIAEGFVATMVDWLDQHAAISVTMAHDGASLQAGCAVVAPETTHVRVTSQWKVIFDPEPHHLLYPSIDVTLQSAAQALPRQTIGVVLTGMGRDGANGLLALRKAGGMTVAQNRESSAIWGMPRAADEQGGAMELVHADALASRLVELTRQ